MPPKPVAMLRTDEYNDGWEVQRWFLASVISSYLHVNNIGSVPCVCSHKMFESMEEEL